MTIVNENKCEIHGGLLKLGVRQSYSMNTSIRREFNNVQKIKFPNINTPTDITIYDHLSENIPIKLKKNDRITHTSLKRKTISTVLYCDTCRGEANTWISKEKILFQEET